MLMYWAGSSQNGLPTGSKAEIRRWIDLTNKAQYGGTREVSLERAEEKSSVDRPDPVCSIIHIRAKAVYNSRHVAAKLLKHTRNVSYSYLNDEYHELAITVL